MIQYDPHRWFDHFFDVRGTLLVEIFGRVTVCVAWAVAVVAWHVNVAPVAIPATIHSLVGVALGLLLVFRTNASYDRYWEGRKLWGRIVNDSRNFVRGSRVHLMDTEPALFHRLARWTAIFPWAAMSTLQGGSELGPAADELPLEDKTAALKAQHLALYCAQQLTAGLHTARQKGLISDIVEMHLDQNIRQLVDHVGGCERIRKTPLPFAYVVHLRRALVVYCFTLPFALVDTFGWATVFTVLFVAYTFFGIEEIGVEIEGPFGHDENDLPLREICESIHKNVYAVARLASPPRDVDIQGL